MGKKRAVSKLREDSGNNMSMKRRKMAVTQTALHQATKVEARTDGEAGHSVNTGTFSNKNLWDREEFASQEKGEKADAMLTTANPLALSALCARESERALAVKKSRDLLQRLLVEIGKTQSPAPIMAWERWQASAKLGEQLSAQQPSEWLLPRQLPLQKGAKVPDDFGAQSLLEDLCRLAGISESLATQIAAKLLKDSTERARSVAKIGKKDKGKEAVFPTLRQCKHSFDIVFRNRLLKLNIPHMEKLRRLYRGNSEDETAFNTAVYVLLQRYHSLMGHGMQSSCSEHVFDALKRTLKVNFECFASPLNCRYPRYCSAFPDTDGVFGSLGSFFQCFGKPGKFLELFPNGGSFEANPPFIPRVMHEMLAVIERLLSGKSTVVPLSFTLVLPGWQEQGYWARLTDKSNALVKARVLIAASDHGFVSGAQHQRKDRLMDSPFDSALFVLQNDAGATHFPVPSGSFDATMREAFRSALPTAAMRERRMKEGRGFGDKDGGGGVYKGKKKKQGKSGGVKAKGK